MAKKNKSKLPEKIIKYLKKAGLDYKILEHKTVYTAYDAAATMGKKLDEIAKTLLVKADQNYYIVILPASHNVDFKKLGKFLSKVSKNNIKVLKIPGEDIMAKLLKVKAGAMSAFGGIHKLPVVVENSLVKAKRAVFSSGSFNHSIEIAVKDFIKGENALMGAFGIKKKVKLVKPVKVKKAKQTKKKTNKKKTKK